MTDEPVLQFAVAAGPSRDAVALLSVGAHRVGAAIEGDIVLADPSVATQHAVITIPAKAAFREITVAAIDAPVEVDGGDTIAPGQSRLLGLPIRIGIGQSLIDLSSLSPVAAAPEPPETPARTDSSTRFAASVGLLLVLSVALITFGLRDAGPSLPTGLATPAVATPSGLQAPPPPPVAVKADSLRAKLVTIPDLANLSVGEEEGALVLSGPIEAASVIKLAPLQRWFDAEWSGRAVLINRTVIQSVDPPPSLAIEAVWRGRPAPYVLVGGERFLEGAMLEGGWVIQRIEAESVMLRRQNRTVSVRF